MLSVIIPCYNGAATIAVQLEALANQNCSEPWEIIVSDNGSTDETRCIVEQYQKRLPNLRLVDASSRRGSAYARNVGVLAASGDKLVFCDADDEVGSNWVAAMSKALAEHDFVAGRLEPCKLNEAWLLKTRQCPQQEAIQTYKYPPFLPHAGGGNLGIKRTLYEAIGDFDESVFLSDTDYCWRVQRAGITLQFVPDALVHCRFRHTLSGIYHQAYTYGMGNVFLYKKYRSLGMPKLSWQTGLRAWIRLFKKLPRVRSKKACARWLWQFGWRLGRLRGCLKYRVIAL